MRLSAFRIVSLALLSTCCAAQPDPDPTSWFRDITIPAGQRINSATCFFCSVHVEGEVKEDVTAEWGDIDARGVINGDAVAVAGSVHLYPDARVEGDVVSVFGDTRLDDRAQVLKEIVASWGSIIRSPASLPAKSENASGPPFLSRIPARWRTTLVLWFIGVLVSLPLAFLCYWLFGRAKLEKMVAALQARRGKAIFFGCVILAIITTAMALAGNSSWPEIFEPALTIVLLLLLAPGYTALSLSMGRRYAQGPTRALFLGVLIVVTLQTIPILGWILSIMLMVLSLGTFAIGGWRRQAVS